MQRGWCRRDAEHLGVVELALDVAPRLEANALRVLADHVATALMWEPVCLGAQANYIDESQALTWRRLAECVDGPSKQRMLTLAALCEGREVLTVERSDVANLMSTEDMNLLEAAQVAEAAGDFSRAVELLRKTVRPLDDGWMTDLEFLIEHGHELTPAMWGRWICHAAVRYCLAHPFGSATAEHYAVAVLVSLGAPPEHVAKQSLERAHYDQMLHDALLFDEGGLRVFLDDRLSPEVAARAPGLQAWPDVEPSVVRLIEEMNGDALCRDLTTGANVVVGDRGLADENPAGSNFYGRLVRVGGDDRWFFAMRPTICDDLTAGRLAAAIRDAAGPERRLIEAHRSLGVGVQPHATA
jgi:hypothetical protein